MFKAIAIAAAVLLTGCATTQPQVVRISAPFDDAAAAQAMKAGPNAVTGSAFLRQRGGSVVTCAGAEVILFPATAYSSERMQVLYGAGSDGVRVVAQHRQPVQFDPDPQGYKTSSKVTRCDAQGKFAFEKIADGDWFVVTTVVWSTGQYNAEGGTLMQRFSLREGETKSLVMSR